MLIPEIAPPVLYDGVACDVLIFPDVEGKMSDSRLKCQYQAYVQKHFVHELTPAILKSLHAEFVACHVSGSETHPHWLCHSINQMTQKHATAYLKSQGVNSACTTYHEYSANTSVVSRDLFIELLLNQCNNFYGRAVYDSKLLTANPPFSLSMEFPTDTVSCDILVPFNNTKYIRETLDGLLAQNNADCVVHAIDDYSEQNCDDFLRDYPTVRWYRNKHNIGQFMSINNVLNRCETEFLVINDADDISEPDRVWLAITAMKLYEADIYGSQTTQFVQNDDAPEVLYYHHVSVKPDGDILHPLTHGTMVVRKSVFEQLGGYVDFGNLSQNKCGNDTEFMIRAFYSGCRFHIGQSKSVRIRLHGTSCINYFGHQSIARRNTVREIMLRKGIFKRNFDSSMLYGAGFDNSHLTERIN